MTLHAVLPHASTLHPQHSPVASHRAEELTATLEPYGARQAQARVWEIAAAIDFPGNYDAVRSAVRNLIQMPDTVPAEVYLPILQELCVDPMRYRVAAIAYVTTCLNADADTALRYQILLDRAVTR